jgi:glucokinase
MIALALDIGGTKFAGALIDTAGTILARAELPIGPDPTATLGELVRHMSAEGVVGVGIGSAGPLDPIGGTVSPVNIPLWREFALVKCVSEMLPGVPVKLAGDAQCMALGEWWQGPFRDQGDRRSSAMLGIVVSTGIGGGIVIDGAPYLGPTGNAGHIGHVVAEPGGEPCPCGGRGCLERISSGPSMVRWALANGWTVDDGEPDARRLAADAQAGVEVAKQAFQRGADALGIAILAAAVLFDLDDVVIGGGVSASGPTLLDPLRQVISRNTGLGFVRRLRVLPTSLGRDAGLYGAAALVLPLVGTRE